MSVIRSSDRSRPSCGTERYLPEPEHQACLGELMVGAERGEQKAPTLGGGPLTGNGPVPVEDVAIDERDEAGPVRGAPSTPG